MGSADMGAWAAMPTATPKTLVEVLTAVITSAAEEAARQPEQLQQLIEEAGDDRPKLPPELLDRLKKLVSPPDWFSLLAFVLVKVSEVDDQFSGVRRSRSDYAASGMTSFS